jgi:hypothetical protein
MDIRHCVVGSVCVLAVAVHLAAQEPPAVMRVAVEKGLLTCSIRTAPLAEVLEALADRTDVSFVPTDTIRGDDVTLEMTNVPVEAGLRRLLRRYDTFMYYDASGDLPSLRTVWIYPRGLGAGLQPGPQHSLAVPDSQEHVVDADSRIREEAYAALISKDDQASRELLVDVLRGTTEPDEGVRERLLTETINQGMKLPRDLLTDLARTDASELIRLRALDALADDPAGVDAATAAAGDPSPMVRERAQQILAAQAASNRRPPQ